MADSGNSNSSSTPIPEICVGAVVIDEGHLLLIKRGRGAGIGQWSVPGGRVEPGESLAKAIEREVLEETNLGVACGPFVGWAERISDQHHFVIMDFYAQLMASQNGSRGSAKAGDDAAAVAWVSVAELQVYDLVAGLYDFLEEHGIIGDLSS